MKRPKQKPKVDLNEVKQIVMMLIIAALLITYPDNGMIGLFLGVLLTNLSK